MPAQCVVTPRLMGESRSGLRPRRPSAGETPAATKRAGHQFNRDDALVRISHHTRGDKSSPRTSRRRPQTSLGLPSLAIVGDSYAM